MDRLLLFERMSTNHMTKKIEKKFRSFAIWILRYKRISF